MFKMFMECVNAIVVFCLVFFFYRRTTSSTQFTKKRVDFYAFPRVRFFIGFVLFHLNLLSTNYFNFVSFQ